MNSRLSGGDHSPSEERSQSTADAGDARTQETFAREHLATLRGRLDGIYVLPPDARGAGDDKEGRRHAVVALPSDVRVGSAIYGTKSAVAAGLNAPHRRLWPRSGREGNGLGVPTYLYPTVLTYVYSGELTDRRGVLTDLESIPLRREMRRALGIGRGRQGDAGVPADTWRGRIVEFPTEIVERHHVEFGAVLTCHEHSVAEYDQVVVPLAVSDPTIDDPEQDVVSDDPDASALLATEAPVVWIVPMTFTIHQRRQPLTDTTKRISPEDLRRIEDVLIARLRLH
jgi:hypothetical protein